MTTDPRLAALRHQALDAAAAGRLADADRLWRQLLAQDPDQPDALHFFAQQAMRQNDMAMAAELLRRAAPRAPGDVLLQLNLALASRLTGDDNGEDAALQAALAADPACFPALLARADLLERRGLVRQAARISKDALAITPPDDRLSPSLAQMADNARRRVAVNADLFADFLRERINSAHLSSPRAKEALAIASGKTRAYVHQPTMLHFPALPPISFYDRELFPWLAELEAATDTVQQELAGVLERDAKGFAPYVAHREGVPLNQWAALNNSPKWNAWFLWKNGEPQAQHQALCPQTTQLLTRMPMADVPGAAPAAFFSVLEPGAHIPPHTGVTNTRLIVHLPLVAPKDCRFRVGNDTRTVERGNAWVFDDSIEHEAWNDSAQTRIILIFDIWNPLLSDSEKALVQALVAGMSEYYGTDA